MRRVRAIKFHIPHADCPHTPASHVTTRVLLQLQGCMRTKAHLYTIPTLQLKVAGLVKGRLAGLVPRLQQIQVLCAWAGK